MPDLLIRPAHPEDVPAIVDFQILMARETEGLELDRPTVEAGVAAGMADLNKAVYYVAERDGKIVGGLMTTFEWSDWRNGMILWIQSVYVIAEERGRGVYRALYEHLKGRVEEDPGLKGIRLYVDKRNAAAQAVYSKLGMNGEHYATFEWIKL